MTIETLVDRAVNCRCSFTPNSPILQIMFKCRYNEVRLLLTRLKINDGAKIDSDNRFKNIEPAIETIRILHSLPQNARLQKWYSTRYSDYVFAMLTIDHAWKKYPPADREYISEARNLGLEMAEQFGMEFVARCIR